MKDVEKKATKNAKSKKSKISSKEEPNTSHCGSDEMDDKIKLRKEAAQQRNIKKLEQPKKRKISEKTDFDAPGKKQNKLAKRQKLEDNNSDDDGSISEDGQSPVSAERIAKVSHSYDIHQHFRQMFNFLLIFCILTEGERKTSTWIWETGGESEVNNQSSWNEVCTCLDL